MVIPPLLFCFGALIFGTLIFGALLLIALMLLASLAFLEDESKPDLHQQIHAVGRQAKHTARRASEEYLRRASELLTEKRQSR